MPTYGLEVYDDNQRLQFNTDLFLFFVRKTGTAATVGGDGFSTNLLVPGRSSYPSAFVGFSGGNGYAIGYDLNGGVNWGFVSDAPVGTSFNYFIIDTSDKIPASNFGLEVANASGQIVFSASQRVLRAMTLLSMPDDNSVSVTYGGRALGVIPTAWGGYNRYDDSQSGDPSLYYHDWSIYAAAVTNSGHTVETRVVGVPGGRGDVSGTRPTDNAFEIPAKFIVIDVGGIPIGQTFF